MGPAALYLPIMPSALFKAMSASACAREVGPAHRGWLLRDDAGSCCFDWRTWASRTRSRCCRSCPAATGTRMRRSWPCGIRSRYCNATPVTSGSGSRRRIGRCWPRCCARCHGRRCGDCGCWCVPTQSSGGTAIWSRVAMPPCRGPADAAGAPDPALDPYPRAALGKGESQLGISAVSFPRLPGDFDVPRVGWSPRGWLHATDRDGWTLSYSTGLSMPSALWRRCRLWKISR